MLTIGQLAAYAGVTVRAVRHYHAKGLLPEPERDYSGYRRYDAAAVVELIRIRTLAEAGVPLSRVKELLAAGDEEFGAAVADIDRRLRAEIRDRQRHRERIAQLAAGESLALPPEAVAYLERLRELGIAERMIEGERDAWILVAAQLPAHGWRRTSGASVSSSTILRWSTSTATSNDMIDWEPGDPRLPALADRLVAQLNAVDEAEWEAFAEDGMSDDLVALLDSMFLDQVPVARDLMRLVEQRGWTGWTNLQRIDPGSG